MAQLKDTITESYAKPQDFNMRPSFVGDVILWKMSYRLRQNLLKQFVRFTVLFPRKRELQNIFY